MKKTIAILFSALLIASFAACGAQKPAPVAPPSSDTTVSDAADVPATAEAGMEISTERLVVADAALFTGVIEDFAMSDDGKTVWMLKGDDGSTLKAAVDENTKFSFDSTGLGNGARLEVYYGGEGDVVSAIAANRLDTPDSGFQSPDDAPAVPADALTYDGIIVAVNLKDQTENGSDGSIEMTDAKGENGYVFNFAKDTTYIGVDLTTLKAGDKLRVIHSQIATRSIPPQSPAFQILPAQE